VTGSNSTLLSGELATLLTGRTVEFEILPFSFKEMKDYYMLNNIPWDDDLFYDYLKWGGFPLRFDYKSEAAIQKYLSTLYESIVSRDIVKKSSSIDKKSFMDISLYILANAGKELSIDNIVKEYGKIGKRNHNAIEHGKLAKHMMHLIRLYLMCLDILNDGEIITYREKDHDFLMEIRNGKYLDENRQPIPEFFDIVDDLEAKLDVAKKTTDLPDNPDYKKINEFVASVNERIVKGEI
jgi:hypothetical protein